jgi:F-type H+-transporting ATPase subunit b
MPQIAQILETYASQVFWMLITFGVIYFMIGRGMLPKIDATVDARDRKIADDLAAAERAKADSEGMEEAWQAELQSTRAAAQVEAAKAKAKAANDGQGRIAKADAELAAKVAAAEKSIAKARSKALGNLESIATDAAADLVAKVSGAKVTSVQAAKAVKAVMSHG